MKIAFDFNGILDVYPQIVFPFIELLRASGHQVGLCTGNASSAFPKEYKDYWDFTIFCDNAEQEMKDCGRVSKKHEDKMKYWKSAILKKNNVDIIFEDHAKQIEGTMAIQIGKPMETFYQTEEKSAN
jgi:hypothetical protein